MIFFLGLAVRLWQYNNLSWITLNHKSGNKSQKKYVANLFVFIEQNVVYIICFCLRNIKWTSAGWAAHPKNLSLVNFFQWVIATALRIIKSFSLIASWVEYENLINFVFLLPWKVNDPDWQWKSMKSCLLLSFSWSAKLHNNVAAK